MKIYYLLPIIRLLFIFSRYSLSELFLGKYWLLWLNPYYLFSNHKLNRGNRLRLALERAGPIFIKFGQILSTRYDALPIDIITDLSKLRDQVRPIKQTKIKKIMLRTYGDSFKQLFQSFDAQPLASASIAQVHAAVLQDGTGVVVKILKPGIHRMIHRDIRLLEFGAALMTSLIKRSRKLKPLALVNEIKSTLLGELNLENEANNASKFRKYAETIEHCYIPKIYWEYCQPNILVLEAISGVPIQETEKLIAYGVNLSTLAHTCINVFFTQIFRDRFFHADLHPGNIFVNIRQPSEPVIELVDFGIAGTLTLQDQKYIAENMLAFIQRDYFKVAELHLQAAWIPDQVPLEAFAAAIKQVCEPMLDKPLKDISFAALLKGLIDVAKRYHIDIQPQLLLLQKTLLNIEGLCRQLDPSIDLWATAKPIIQHWLQRQVGPRAFLKKLSRQLPQMLHKAPELPDILCQFIQNIDANNHQIRSSNQTAITTDSMSTSLTTSNTNTKTKNSTKLLWLCLLILLLLFINGYAVPIWLVNSLIIIALIIVIFA